MKKYIKKRSPSKIIALIALFALIFQTLFPVLLLNTFSAGPVFAGADPPDEPSKTYDIEGMKKIGSWSSDQLCLAGEDCYTEGDYVPFRLRLGGLTSGASYNVIVQMHYSEWGNFGYETIQHPSAFHSDIGATSVNTTVVGNPACGGAFFCQNTNITFSATNSNAVIHFDGLLGIDSTDLTRASLEMKILEANGGDYPTGEVVSLQVNQIKQLPSLTLIKELEGEYQDASPSEWCFNVAPQIGGVTEHCITGSYGNGTDRVIFENLLDTSYSVTEVGPERYSNSGFEGTNCVATGDSTAIATVAPGTTPTDAHCTFINERSLGSLSVAKNVIGPNGEDVLDISEQFGLSLDLGEGEVFNLTDGSEELWNGIPTGVYTIIEEGIPDGYQFESYSIDEDLSTPGAQVTVSTDQLTSLEVINRQVGATLHVTKHVTDPLGNPTDDTTPFEVSLDGGPLTQIVDGETLTFDSLLPGVHVLDEVGIPSGYFLSAFDIDEDPGTLGAQLILENNQETFLNITNQQDLSVLLVEKSDSIDPVPVGANFSYTITAENEGPHTLHDVSISDQLPSPFELLSVTPSVGSCVPDYDNDSFTCDIGDQTVGQVASVVVDASVPTTAIAGTYENVSSISAYEYPEPLQASETTTVSDLFDLTVSKTASVDSTVAGDINGFDFTIEVMNDGPAAARNILLLDSIPSQFNVVQVDADETVADCDLADNDLMCSIDLLLDQEETTIVVSVNVPYDVDTQVIENVVNLRAGDTQWEARDSVTVIEEVDLVVTKDDGVDLVKAGENFTYSMTVQNSKEALSDADGVVLEDIIPAPFVATGVDNSSCTLSGNNLLCNWYHLAPGEIPEEINVSVEVPATADPGTYVNSAIVASDEDVEGQEAMVSTSVEKESSLWIEKVDSVDPVTAGLSDFSYTISFGNDGPSSADNVVLVDHLPPQLQYVGYSVVPGDLDFTCDFGTPSMPPVDSSYSGRDALNCNVGTVLPGESAEVGLIVQIAGRLDVDVTMNYVDIFSGDGDHASTVESTQFERRIQLNVSKWDQFSDVDFAVAGEDNVVYTVRVWNDGLLTANNLLVSDTLPSEFSFVSADERCVYDEISHSVTCQIESLPNGVVEEFLITTALGADLEAGRYLNEVVVSGEGEIVTADEWTNVAEVNDFEISKRLMTYNVTYNKKTMIKYEIDIKNTGPSDAEGVEVWEDLTGVLGHLDQSVKEKSRFRIVTSEGITCGEIDFTREGISCYIGDMDIYVEEDGSNAVWFKLFIDIPEGFADGNYENVVEVWSEDGSSARDSIFLSIVDGK